VIFLSDVVIVCVAVSFFAFMITDGLFFFFLSFLIVQYQGKSEDNLFFLTFPFLDDPTSGEKRCDLFSLF